MCPELENKRFYMITNETEHHGNFQYTSGLNTTQTDFPENHFCFRHGLMYSNTTTQKYDMPNGFCFTDIDNVLDDIHRGVYLRVVDLPLTDPDFKYVEYRQNKWTSNKIILKEKMDLRQVSTFHFIIDMGVDIKNHAKSIIKWASSRGLLDIIKFLSDTVDETFIFDCYYSALLSAVEKNNIDIVKFFVNKGVDLNEDDGDLICVASQYGYLDVVKYLVESEADIHADNDYSLRVAAVSGKLDIVKLLVENGADIRADNDYALQWACINGHLEIVKYLVESGADVNAINNDAIKQASEYGYLEVVKYLVDSGACVPSSNN